MVRERDLAGPRPAAPADEPRRRDRVVRRTERALAHQAARRSPAAPWTCVISIASSSVGGGRIPGRRRASIVLPAPGGPTISRLWPPAAAISSARRASAWPRTSARSGARPARGARRGRRRRPARAPPRRGADRAARRASAPPITSSPSTSAASGAFAAGRAAAEPAARAPSAIASAPRTGLISPQSDSSPQTAQLSSASRQHLPARREHRHGDRQVEARARLAHARRREVDGHPLLRELEPGVRSAARTRSRDSRTARSGRPDDRERRQPPAHVHLDRHLAAVDALEGECRDPCEHDRHARWAATQWRRTVR